MFPSVNIVHTIVNPEDSLEVYITDGDEKNYLQEITRIII